MSKHVSLTPASENLLKMLVGTEITDVLGRDDRGRYNEETGRLEVTDVGLVAGNGQRILIWVRAFEIVPKLEGFLLEVTTSFDIRKWPGGPLVEWVSIAERIPGFARSRIKSVSVVESLYDKDSYYEDHVDHGLEATSVDEGLAIDLENGQTFIVAASLEVPTVIELFWADSKGVQDWSRGKKLRFLGTT